MRKATDCEITFMRSDAVKARDWLRVALCDMALDRDSMEIQEHRRELTKLLGVYVYNISAADKARVLCAEVIDEMKR